VVQENILRLPESSPRLLRGSGRFISFLLCIFSVISFVGCGGLVSHKVEQGDSLYSIGFYYGHDYRDIAKWNNISSPYVIHKGEWLRVAPPDERWSSEQKQRKRESKFDKNPSNNSKNRISHAEKRDTQRTTQANRPQIKSTKRIVAEDFTDKTSRINKWVWPAKGRLLDGEKKFSQRNKGIDIAGRRGQSVYATADGKVVYSGSGLIGYGKLIIIKHNKTYLSAYAHNEKILVTEGAIVKRAQKIAHMGRTPDNRIQLHFEIRRNGKPVDPLRYLK